MANNRNSIGFSKAPNSTATPYEEAKNQHPVMTGPATPTQKSIEGKINRVPGQDENGHRVTEYALVDAVTAQVVQHGTRRPMIAT
jgi:hypothetical protein